MNEWRKEEEIKNIRKEGKKSEQRKRRKSKDEDNEDDDRKEVIEKENRWQIPRKNTKG